MSGQHEGAELRGLLRELGATPLSKLGPGIDTGLGRIREVANRLQLLPNRVPTLIVAGTNGKGSTCVAAEALLRAQGFRVGCTLSPHIRIYNERIRVDGEIAADAWVISALNAIESARRDVPLSYFEIATLAALWVFREQACEVQVLEVGLGGRLDAANVCDAHVAVVTSIGLDHAEWLGTDLNVIGLEKAAIRRSQRPLVLGSDDLPISLVELADSHDGDVYVRGQDYWLEPAPSGPDGRVRIAGSDAYDIATGATIAADNIATALVAVSALTHAPTQEEWRSAQADLHLPGRLQPLTVKGREVLVDVAHNPAGAAFLGRQLNALRRGEPNAELHVVFGCYADKDAAQIVSALLDEAAPSSLALVPTSGFRGQSAEDVASSLATESLAGGAKLGIWPSVEAGIANTCSSASAGDIICAFGSFDVVSVLLELADDPSVRPSAPQPARSG